MRSYGFDCKYQTLSKDAAERSVVFTRVRGAPAQEDCICLVAKCYVINAGLEHKFETGTLSEK